mgnify:CR=1 FL=1|jgi:hypothetical protein
MNESDRVAARAVGIPNTSSIGDSARIPGFDGFAGVAARDITPPVGIRNRNWGPATTDIATGVHRPFQLTALAVSESADDEPVVIFGVDATWWRRVADYAELEAALVTGLGMDADRFVFCLSHTHAGAVLGAGDVHLPGGEFIEPYLRALREAAVAAGREAIATRQPAAIDWATGRCDLAADRESQVGDRAVVGFNPTRPADDAVLVGRITAADGRVLGTVVNYACHPTTLAWQNSLLSPDYVGAMRELVEDATGAPCLFLQGASGDLAPREQYVGDTSIADRHGRMLGHAALSALASMPPAGAALQLVEVVESGAPLGMWTATPSPRSHRVVVTRAEVELDVRPLPTLEDLAAEWSDIDPKSRDERLRRAHDVRDGYIDGPIVRHPLWTIRLGDAVIVAHPGEAYSEFQIRLRDRFPDRAIVAVNLANGPGFVYLPTDDAYQRAAYQAWQTVLAPGGLRRLTDAAIRQVESILD